MRPQLHQYSFGRGKMSHGSPYPRVGGGRGSPMWGFPPTMPFGRSPLPTEEKARRRSLDLCLHCGQAGHQWKNCPVSRSQRDRRYAPQRRMSSSSQSAPSSPKGKGKGKGKPALPSTPKGKGKSHFLGKGRGKSTGRGRGRWVPVRNFETTEEWDDSEWHVDSTDAWYEEADKFLGPADDVPMAGPTEP
jgi:hypothetical protein